MSWIPDDAPFWDVFPVLKRGYWYGDYDSKKLEEYEFWHDGIGNWLTLGFTSKHIDQSIAQGKNDAYLKRHDIDADDVVDPSNLYGDSSFSGLAVNFVSDNIKRLYR